MLPSGEAVLTDEGGDPLRSSMSPLECEDLDNIFSKLLDYGVAFIHTIKEQPWGQRVFRFFDPDNHIVEIGEPMSVVIRRYLKEGASETEVAKRTSMPIEEVLNIQSEIDKNS